MDDRAPSSTGELRVLEASYLGDMDAETDEEATGDCHPGVPAEMTDPADRTTKQPGHQPPGDGAAWWTHARCNDGSGRLAGVFFSRELQDIARAKRLCLSCPAVVPCLEGALERREPWGVWGGQLFVDGTIVATKRRRGRPRKVPRPEDQLPEVPLPQHLRGVPVVRTA
jgi:WhiB family redox-sensing transcriptional regulator